MPSKQRCNSGSDSDGAPQPSKRSKGAGPKDEYRAKRNRNNIAVRKSREKSRQQAKETMQKVTLLKRENEDLEMKVKLLSKELNLLKDMFLSHASFAPSVLEMPEVKAEEVVCDMTVNSGGETENSVDSVDSNFLDMYGFERGAGTFVNAEAVQKDHEYSVPLAVK